MRRNLLKLVLTCMALLGGLVTSKAQTPPVLPYNHIWSYWITNAAPPGWNASNYPAASEWFLGAGVAAFPGDEDLPTPLASVQTLLNTNFNGNIVTSFYFRTSITITQAIVSNLVFNAAAIIDDGAVFYVNGREITRIRMPTGTITHNTFANAGGEVAARIDTFAIAGTNFVRGTNVIAVEVHQDAAASSDVVFGLQLTPITYDPVTITAQPYPQSQTIDTGLRATFEVGALGEAVRYQWHSNNVPITGATSWSYQTPVMNSPSASTGIVYHVVVSNAVNSIRSSNAVLVVETDHNGPQISQVRTDGAASNRLLLTFSEPIATPTVYPGVTNIANYSITTIGSTNQIAITNVQFGSVTLLRLFLDQRVTSTNEYVICANNIPDSRSNFTASTCAAFDRVALSNVFPMGSTWRFQNFALDLSQEDWTSPGYDDSDNSGWGAGFGSFYFDPDGWVNPCSDKGTTTSKGPRTTYFRKKFTLTPATLPTNDIVLNVRHASDDGAVFYINGQEIQRYNMPPAPTAITYFTVATTEVGNATVCQTFAVPIPRGRLRVGTENVVAVELHQQEADLIGGNSDLAFDMELNFQRDVSFVPSRLTITRGTGNVLVTWTGSPPLLIQGSPSPFGPWTTLTPNAGANGYRTTPGVGQWQFFRTRTQ